MMLSVNEAADLLQVSPRTVRARLARGELPGRKVTGQWRIPRRALPLSEAAHRSLQRRADEVRAAVEDALPSRGSRRRDGRRASLADVTTFQGGARVLQQLRAPVGEPVAGAPAAADEVEAALLRLAEGWHEFSPAPRLDALQAARAGFARAVARLLLAAGGAPDAGAAGLIEVLELQVLGEMAGLFRAAERRLRRGDDR